MSSAFWYCRRRGKDRNLVHFRDLEYREYNAYTVPEVNEYIAALVRFREAEAVTKLNNTALTLFSVVFLLQNLISLIV